MLITASLYPLHWQRSFPVHLFATHARSLSFSPGSSPSPGHRSWQLHESQCWVSPSVYKVPVLSRCFLLVKCPMAAGLNPYQEYMYNGHWLASRSIFFLSFLRLPKSHIGCFYDCLLCPYCYVRSDPLHDYTPFMSVTTGPRTDPSVTHHYLSFHWLIHSILNPEMRFRCSVA